MQNLAGKADCDVQIKRELERARIDIVALPSRLDAEVPASVVGRLGRFRFRRAWYYWMVAGPVPLPVAQELYADPVGIEDVRVAGHCGCPPPEKPWLRNGPGDQQFVMSYHIDSEVGLRLFADTLKKHGLV